MSSQSASELFSEGNEAFVDEDFSLAVEKYTSAINQSPTNLASCYLKRATAYEKLEQFGDALGDLEKCLSLEAENSRAKMKKGVMLFRLERFEDALPVFQSLTSDDKSKVWIRKCEAEIDYKEQNTTTSEGSIQMGFSHNITNIKDVERSRLASATNL